MLGRLLPIFLALAVMGGVLGIAVLMLVAFGQDWWLTPFSSIWVRLENLPS